MTRNRSRRARGAWFVGGLLIWSCASKSESGPRADNGGASAGNGGHPSEVAGAPNDPAGGAANAGAVGLSGSGGRSDLDASPGEGGRTPDAGVDNQGGAAGDGASNAAGADGAEAGAGGSDESLTPFEGRCGQGWTAPGGSARPALAASVTPQVDTAGNWTFSFGRYRFVIAASHGAKVTEFSIDGLNVLDATGSTFWPSPQQAYPWPVPAEIDTGVYKAQVSAATLNLTSATAKTIGLSVKKRIWVNAESSVVNIEYQLINQSKQSASWAPWEVTRVRAGGYTFAPLGPGTRTITEDTFQLPLPLTLLPPAPAAHGIEWLDYPGVSTSLTKDNYIIEFDGAEGWLAHANRFGKSQLPVLFVKSFVDAPDEQLPSTEAEIQLWTSGTTDPKLIEVEEQGAQVELLPGAALTWTVHWSACELPSAQLLAAGNASLAAFARALAIKP